MPFGLKNASATFQRAMTEILRPAFDHGTRVFIDDIVVFGSTMEQLLERMERVFSLLEAEGLTLKSKKCELFRTEVEVLGHKVSAEGVSPLDQKLDLIKEWKTPHTKKGVRQFLGLCSYYRQHIVDFAKMAAPLHKLTGKNSQWQWTLREEEAFEQLKVKLTEAPVLQLFDNDKEVIIDCDASAFAIGAVLTQRDIEGAEKPVAYFSRCLSRAESNYCVTRRELLAVLESLRHWRHHTSGMKVLIRTDHSALKWLKSFKLLEGQLARWMEELAQYNLEIIHRPGAQMINADALSRRPCNPTCAHCSRREEREGEYLTAAIHLQDQVDWSKEQDMDMDLKAVKEWLAADAKPEWEMVSGCSMVRRKLWCEFQQLKLCQGVLQRTFHLPNSQIHQIIIPVQMRQEILSTIHTQGHFGITRTRASLQQRFYWPGWRSQVTNHVNSCTPCNQRKGPHQRVRPPHKKYLVAEPLQRVAIDILGPLPLTTRGNKYLLVMGDYFTKWVEALPLPNQEAETVADALIQQVFSRLGVPQELHSDQGRNFESRVFKLVCERLGVHKTRTTPYRPQSDGMVERFNRTLIDALAKVTEDDDDWDKIAPIVCMYYRASTHRATGFSPALLMLGRELNLPLDLLYPVSDPDPNANPHSYLQKLEERLSKASEVARRHMEIDWEQRERGVNRFQRGARPIDLHRPVYVFNPAVAKGRTPKLARLWRGPHQVTEKLSEHLYRVRVGARNQLQVIHRSHLFQPRRDDPVPQ
jgi:hypothetical protein